MRAISLFSGVGGFELGFDRAGIETVLQAEKDPWCLKVLERHWPDVLRKEDVRFVTRAHAAPDLVYGGFPCQDLSVAGKRAGLGGDRSSLWFEFERVLRQVRPRWAVIENVRGILSSDGGRDFYTIISALDGLGFSVAWAVLDAKWFGVPQSRQRVFIVAGPSRRGCEQVLDICEGCGGSAAPGQVKGKRTPRRTVAGAEVSGRARLVDARCHGCGERWCIHHEMHYTDCPCEGNETQCASCEEWWDEDDQSFCPYCSWVPSRIYVPEVTGTLSDGAHHGGGLNGQDFYSGRVIATHQGPRRLTPIECERVMGWPDDHTRYDRAGNEILDGHRYRMCGNGVVATVAEWIGRRLMEVDRNDHLR